MWVGMLSDDSNPLPLPPAFKTCSGTKMSHPLWVLSKYRFLSNINIVVLSHIWIILNSPIPVHFSSVIPKMSIFTLTISCLTTSKLPWFMDLTIQVPSQYSLQHRTLLSPPDTSTTGCCFHFFSASSLLLELFLCSSLFSSSIVCWAPTDLGSLPFSVLSLCLFILFMGFSRQECWSGFPSITVGKNSLEEME